MGIFTYILGSGMGGLSGQKAAQQIASTNIANVNTPGYVRQRLWLGAVDGLAGVGTRRAQGPRNRLLMDHIGGVKGQLGFHSGHSKALLMLEYATNEIEGNGLGPRMTEFQETLRALEADPGSLALRKEVLNGARKLSAAFKATRKQFMDGANTVHYEMKYTANEVTRMSAEIAHLNQSILESNSYSEVPNLDLEAIISKRDHLVGQVSELVDTTIIHDKNGTVDLYVAGGRLLVDGGMSNAIKVSEMGVGPNYNVDIQITSLDGPLLDPVQGFGGQLGGLKEGYDNSIRDGVNRIDELAFNYMKEFNVRHQGGFGLGGANGLDFFQDPGVVVDGAAIFMQLDAAVEQDPDLIAAAAVVGNLPGGNGNLSFLADALDDLGVLADGSSILGAWTNLKFDITNRMQLASMGMDTERASALQLENLFQSEAGVSLDEEMIAMAQAKTAFDAASQVIRTADEMAQTILMMVR